MRRLLLVALVALTACVSTGTQNDSRWSQLSAEHYRLIGTPEGAAWEREFISAHNEFWPDVYAACAKQAMTAGIHEFSGIAVVGRTGLVEQFLVMPDSAGLDCFVDQMVGRRYPPPPVAPFYELIDFVLTDD